MRGPPVVSFELVDFWPKIYLILYPSLGKLTTHIAITKGAWHYNDVEEACYRPNPSQSNFCVIGTMGIDFFRISCSKYLNFVTRMQPKESDSTWWRGCTSGDK